MPYACHYRSGPRPTPRRPLDPHAALAKQILRVADDVNDAIARARLLGPEQDAGESTDRQTFCFRDGSILTIRGAQLAAYASHAELERSFAASAG